jgi:hypothetical protein
MSLPNPSSSFKISKFNQDILPSCLCFLATVNYLLFDNVPTIFLSIAGATSITYLLTHPLGYNFTFHANTAKTPVEEVRYDVTRSLFHGLTATCIFSHTCVKVMEKGLPRWSTDETWGIVKIVAWVTFVAALWLASMGVAWYAAVGDVGKWGKVADEITEDRKEKNKFLEDRSLVGQKS